MEHKLHNKIPANYIVVDIETTGFKPTLSSIVEIGAVRYNTEGLKVNQFSSLLKLETSDTDGTKHTEKINNISDIMLVNAPEIDKVLNDFLNFIEDDVLIAHNGIAFDFPFLESKIRKHLNKSIDLGSGSIDTLFLARRFLNLPNNKLETICNHFKIVNNDAHRAIGDCEATNKVFLSIITMRGVECKFPRVPKRR